MQHLGGQTKSIMVFSEVAYLTIRPIARKGYWAIAHEAKPNGLLIRGPEGEGSNCFSITQLIGQKKAIINSAKKYLFGNKMK